MVTNNRLKFLIGVIAMLLLPSKFFAQHTEFIIGSASNITSTVIQVPVKAINFKQISGWQGSINWDDSKINYLGISNIDPTLKGLQYANSSVGGSGRLSFMWIDSALGNQTIADSSVLFYISFKVVYSGTGNTAVTFSNAPTPLQLLDVNYNNVATVNYTDGQLYFTGVTITPQFIIGTLTNVSSSTISVPVFVKDFKQILGFQGSINWNNTELGFTSISNISATLNGLQYNNTDSSTSGRLRYFWIDPNLDVQSLADSAVLFTINFTVINNSAGISKVVFSGNPSSLLVVESTGSPLQNVQYTDGNIVFAGSILSPMFIINPLGASNSLKINIPITVQYFNQIKALQGSVVWDNNKYNFSAVVNGASVFNNLSYNATVNGNNGYLSYLWMDSLLIARTVSDNSILFTLVLDRICGAIGIDDIKFSTIPVSASVINNKDSIVQNVTYVNGKVSIPSFVTPSVWISTASNNICSGKMISFSTSVVNGGSLPVFQWYKNSAMISTAKDSVFKSASLNYYDTIYCSIKGNGYCADTATVFSNAIVVLPNITTKDSVTYNGCKSYTYKGATYLVNTQLNDTLFNANGCDSIYRKVYIVVNQLTPQTSSVNLSGCNSVTYKLKVYTISTIVRDTVKSYQGCDSIYTIANINVNKITPTTNSINLSGCKKVVYNGKTYTSTTVLRDTVKSYQGCDSLYTVTTITVNTACISFNNVTFSVDITNYLRAGNILGSGGIRIAGDFPSIGSTLPFWIPTAAGCAMTKQGSSNVWSITISVPDTAVGKSFEYKFVNTNWGTNEGTDLSNTLFVGGCGVANQSNNRFLILPNADTSVAYCWDQCSVCNIAANLPTVRTNAVSNVSNAGATMGCNLIATGGDAVLAAGYVYSTSSNPSAPYSPNYVWTNPAIGMYNYAQTGLLPNTTYYVRAFAANSIGTVYGSEVSFTTLSCASALSNTINLNGCDSVVFKGKVYKTNTTVLDTVRTISGCDSIYNTVSIAINNIKLSGNFYHPKGFAINFLQPATISLSGINAQSITGNNSYNLKCLDYNSAGIIRATKNSDIGKANGVTTLDIALVQSHILQKSTLNSPYKIIAADVNGDGKVTTLDIVYIKRLILGLDTTFAKTTSGEKRLWAFVDSNNIIVNPVNPFPIKDSISYTGITTSKTNQTFIGCKLGDVNWDWNSAVAKPGIAEINTVELSYSSTSTYISNKVRIPVKVKNFKELLGLQFTLNFDVSKFTWVGINNKELNVEVGTNHAAEGKISILWVDAKSELKTLEDGSILFELVFERTGKEAIENTLSVDGSVTAVAAYDKEFGLHDVVLNKMESIPSIPLESWVVAPNPSRDGVIQVQLNLSNKKIVVFRLLDEHGRLHLTRQVEGIKGNNQFTLREGSVPNGTYFLQAVGVEGVKQIRVEN